jgi:diguanylate cyclase (GGDEF)-like protein/PAS domain S-box-containing protein
VVEGAALFCSPDDKNPGCDILLVDGNARRLARLRTMLAVPGYRLTAVRSGSEALRSLEQAADFAVVVIDTDLADLDGYETVRRIRQREALRCLPVVFLLPPGRKCRFDQAAGGPGLVDYLYRPVDAAMLRAKLAVFVELFHMNREMEQWGRKLDEWINERAALIDAVQANYRMIAENVGDLIAMLDRNGKRLYASPSFLRYFGADNVAPGSNSFAIIHPDDRERIAEIFRYTVATGHGRRAEYRLVTAQGEVRYFESEGSPVLDRSGHVTHVVVVSRDITERHLASERMRHLAHHDVLTGLPNRALFADYMNQALAGAKRRQARCAAIFVDLDHFKEINDSLGHAVGDSVLRTVADRLRGCLREEDMVARLGGDEFCVLIAMANGAESVALVARKILQTLAEPMTIAGQALLTSASMGISIYPKDAQDAETLLTLADAAMYQVKNGGRNGFRFYEPGMVTP